ncbi:MAG: hypothetical protein M3140_01130 [Actinomycetota bacterium]|nr:hypothetical protein [Actinomycetota bacterium]
MDQPPGPRTPGSADSARQRVRSSTPVEPAGEPAGHGGGTPDRGDVSRDDLDLGWGERYESHDAESHDAESHGAESEDARMEWLRAQRPPHHE